MAKINITRLPNATPEYSATQFDQMVNLLDQIILLLNTNFQQDLKEEAEIESTRLNSSHTVISYAVFCLKKKNT